MFLVVHQAGCQVPDSLLQVGFDSGLRIAPSDAGGHRNGSLIQAGFLYLHEQAVYLGPEVMGGHVKGGLVAELLVEGMAPLYPNRNIPVMEGKGLHGHLAFFKGKVGFQALQVQFLQVYEIHAIAEGLQHLGLLAAGLCSQHFGHHPPSQAHQVGAEVVVQQAAQANLRIEPALQDGGNGGQGAEQFDRFQGFPDPEAIYPQVHAEFRLARTRAQLPVQGEHPIQGTGANLLQLQALVPDQQGSRNFPQRQVVVEHGCRMAPYGAIEVCRNAECRCRGCLLLGDRRIRALEIGYGQALGPQAEIACKQAVAQQIPEVVLQATGQVKVAAAQGPFQGFQAGGSGVETQAGLLQFHGLGEGIGAEGGVGKLQGARGTGVFVFALLYRSHVESRLQVGLQQAAEFLPGVYRVGLTQVGQVYGTLHGPFYPGVAGEFPDAGMHGKGVAIDGKAGLRDFKVGIDGLAGGVYHLGGKGNVGNPHRQVRVLK